MHRKLAWESAQIGTTVKRRLAHLLMSNGERRTRLVVVPETRPTIFLATLDDDTSMLTSKYRSPLHTKQ